MKRGHATPATSAVTCPAAATILTRRYVALVVAVPRATAAAPTSAVSPSQPVARMGTAPQLPRPQYPYPPRGRHPRRVP